MEYSASVYIRCKTRLPEVVISKENKKTRSNVKVYESVLLKLKEGRNGSFWIPWKIAGDLLNEMKVKSSENKNKNRNKRSAVMVVDATVFCEFMRKN